MAIGDGAFSVAAQRAYNIHAAITSQTAVHDRRISLSPGNVPTCLSLFPQRLAGITAFGFEAAHRLIWLVMHRPLVF